MSIQLAVGLLWVVRVLYIIRVEKCLHALLKVHLALHKFIDAVIQKIKEEEVNDSRS